jgi:hypothetical protein
MVVAAELNRVDSRGLDLVHELHHPFRRAVFAHFGVQFAGQVRIADQRIPTADQTSDFGV